MAVANNTFDAENQVVDPVTFDNVLELTGSNYRPDQIDNARKLFDHYWRDTATGFTEAQKYLEGLPQLNVAPAPATKPIATPTPEPTPEPVVDTSLDLSGDTYDSADTALADPQVAGKTLGSRWNPFSRGDQDRGTTKYDPNAPDYYVDLQGNEGDYWDQWYIDQMGNAIARRDAAEEGGTGDVSAASLSAGDLEWLRGKYVTIEEPITFAGGATGPGRDVTKERDLYWAAEKAAKRWAIMGKMEHHQNWNFNPAAYLEEVFPELWNTLSKDEQIRLVSMMNVGWSPPTEFARDDEGGVVGVIVRDEKGDVDNIQFASYPIWDPDQNEYTRFGTSEEGRLQEIEALVVQWANMPQAIVDSMAPKRLDVLVHILRSSGHWN